MSSIPPARPAAAPPKLPPKPPQPSTTIASKPAPQKPVVAQPDAAKPAAGPPRPTQPQADKPPGNKSNTGPNIVVVDNATPRIDLDQDRKPDVSHMTLVTSQIRGRLPSATVETLGRSPSNPFPKIMEKLEQDIQNGKKVDAVNLSAALPAEPLHMDYLSRLTGMELTPENLAQKRVAVRDKLFDIAKNPSLAPDPETLRIAVGSPEELREVTGIIQSVEKITARNIPVFVAGGNNQREEVNLILLANGTIGVAGTDKDGELLPSQAQNSLITRKAPGIIDVNPVFNPFSKKFEGFDVNNDGNPEVAASALSGQNTDFKPAPRQRSGSSFAAPVELTNFFLRQPDP